MGLKQSKIGVKIAQKWADMKVKNGGKIVSLSGNFIELGKWEVRR